MWRIFPVRVFEHIEVVLLLLLKAPSRAAFFPLRMCSRLCFWFLCEDRRLLEISPANHATVHVVGGSERQLSPLALRINNYAEEIDPITSFGSTHTFSPRAHAEGNFRCSSAVETHISVQVLLNLNVESELTFAGFLIQY